MTLVKKNIFFSMLLLVLAAVASYPSGSYAQGSPDYKGGMKVGLDESGERYLRLITWHQVNAQLPAGETAAGEDKNFDMRLRRSRFLALAKITDEFLVLTHFGANSADADDLSAVGADGTTRAGLFMLGAWVEYSILGRLLAGGGGLHYWNGISRLTNQSTLNFMTQDAPGLNWATLGTSDQFARHLGLYLKGDWEGKLHYRLALNRPTANSLDSARGNAPTADQAVYRGVELRNSVYDSAAAAEADRIVVEDDTNNAGSLMALQGYVSYNILGTESSFLPYAVGTYLGGKGSVLSVGAGFFMHPEGTVTLDDASETRTAEVGGANKTVQDFETHDVTLIGLDVFLEQPIADSMAFNGYLVYYTHDYGPNYIHPLYSGTLGTGDIIYLQLGYLYKWGEKGRGVMPYITYSQSSLDAYSEFDDRYADTSVTATGLGVNYFISGHHAKISLDYKITSNPVSEDSDPDASDDQTLTLQFAGYI